MPYTKVTCAVCGKGFDQNSHFSGLRPTLAVNDDVVCYNCALNRIIGDRRPNKIDFSIAKIVSGEMTNQEARWLKEDLAAPGHLGEPRWQEFLEHYGNKNHS